MIPRLEVPLIRDVVVVSAFDRSVSDTITLAISQMNGHLKRMISAVLDVHHTDTDDVRRLDEKFATMQVGSLANNGNYHLVLEHVPRGVTWDGEQITRGQQELISEIIRDVVLTPPLEKEPTPEQTSAFIKHMVERTGILRPLSERPRVRSFVWGGHTIPIEEFSFARQIGYWDGLRGTELITGSGGGVMKAPFEGARNGYAKQRLEQPRYIGFTEQGILAGEAPNNLLTTLCVFPDIEKRMEAFIRASHRGRVHPGGTGTMEEIMTFLGMKIHPKNECLVYPFDLVERPEGDYMRRLQHFFRVCFDDALDGMIQFRLETPQDYHRYVSESNKPLRPEQPWNDELYVPPEIQKPFEVNFESMEALDLSREREPFDLIVDLRRFFSAMVYLVVKNPRMLESWGNERPKVRGDKAIIQEVDHLVRWFNDSKRLKMHLKLEKLPYRID